MLSLPTRPLGRFQTPVACVIPRTAGTDWLQLEIDEAAPGQASRDILGNTKIVARMDGQLLNPRNDKTLAHFLAQIHRTSVDILLLDQLSSADLKVGWPTHRLQQYRDRGMFGDAIVAAPTLSDAEWMIDNASVAGVVVPFSPENLDLRYRCAASAQEAGMALLAEASTLEEVRFLLAHDFIASVLFNGQASVETVADAAAHPMGQDEIEQLWQTYQSTHAEPKKLRGNHPPE